MNIPFESDKEIEVRGDCFFTDGKVYTFKVRLSGNGGKSAVHTLVGRTVQELVKLQLTYNGICYQYPLIYSKNGVDLDTIVISGARDQWSQMLREAAMESVRYGSTPEDA